MGASMKDSVFGLPIAYVRTCAALFVVLLASSAYFVQGIGPNQYARMDLVWAMVDQRTFSIDSFAGNTMDKSWKDGHYYSDKAPGLSFASIPPYLASKAVGWPRPDRIPTVMHAMTVAVVGVTSAVAAVLFFLTLTAIGVSRLWAATATAGWVLGTNAFGYLTMYYAHQFVGALLASSFALLHASKEGGWARRASWTVPVAGALGSWAAVSEFPAAIAGLLLFAYGARVLGLRRMLPFAAAAVPPVLLLLAYNACAFGSPFVMGYGVLVIKEVKHAMDQGVFGVGLPRWRPLLEILFGEARGLLPLSPFLVLAVPGAVRMAKDPKLRAEAWLAIAVTVYFVLLNAGYAFWYGGRSMGPRHVVPMLPFTVMLAAKGFEAASSLRRPFGRVAGGACALLVAASIATCTMVVAVEPELDTERFLVPPHPDMALLDMSHPLRAFVFPLFVRGYLSVKGVAPSGGIGLAYTAKGHEWDAFNLGEAMGLKGLASLAPLMTLWALCAVVIAMADRGKARSTAHKA
jgi:hypothetical protein